MVVLYNGEQREFDISHLDNWDQILAGLNYRREKYLGKKHGDFEITNIDYDWGLMERVHIVTCLKCGATKEIGDLPAFMRGKSYGGTCACSYKKNKIEEKQPRLRNEDYVGHTVNGFMLTKYMVGKGFRAKCVDCGKQKWLSKSRVFSGKEKCNHRIVNDYSDPRYVGVKVGSLTSLKYLGREMLFRCDCGTEVIRLPGNVFQQRAVASCGRWDCEYRRTRLVDGKETRKIGVTFEFECADKLKEQGFEVEMTPSTGDYGVDFFAVVDGERVAFQCKKLRTESVIKAVQEVYAGGRYYDCCKFVVVSPSGFTYSAKMMASKLGVQLETSLESFTLKTTKENSIPVSTIRTRPGRKVMWEINGVTKDADQWCKENGITRTCVNYRMRVHKMSLEEALMKPKYGSCGIEIDGVIKSKQEWCDEYGISPQLYDYRIKYSGLSPIEALTKEKARW